MLAARVAAEDVTALTLAPVWLRIGFRHYGFILVGFCIGGNFHDCCVLYMVEVFLRRGEQ